MKRDIARCIAASCSQFVIQGVTNDDSEVNRHCEVSTRRLSFLLKSGGDNEGNFS